MTPARRVLLLGALRAARHLADSVAVACTLVVLAIEEEELARRERVVAGMVEAARAAGKGRAN